MRIIVALRPTNKHGTKGEYTAFRKLLLASGLVLVQPEVFLGCAPTRRAAMLLLERLKEQAPTTGAVCALVLTERQFSSMVYLTGEPSYQEHSVGTAANIDL
ncbi:MAG: CRISPR-associated endonuclease Cas2 [Atopobiaceae bacterium]|nr:CRISPR-associated endonuclease Cas2 [Atopobiaceae bacterium]